jgi:hypothetical protein
MGKFQLNKKGEDPIKIYEDTFKIAQGTVESHLGKLGKMPNPISRESKANEDSIDDDDREGRMQWIMTPNDPVTKEEAELLLYGTTDGSKGGTWTGNVSRPRGESKAREVNGKYIINGMVIGKVTDFEPNNWFGKVELSEMPEFAEYGTLDPQAVVKGDDGVTYTDPKGGSDGSRGTLFNADGSPKPPTVSWGEVEAIAKEAISENEKDEMFQYLFDLQDSGITNMFGAGPYVEREFPHLDKKEVRDVVLEWMKNYEEIHARMGIESKAKEYDDEYEYDDDGTKLNPLYDDDDEYIDGSDVPTSGTYESKAREFYNDTGDAGRFLETPQLQQIRNHWDNVMPEEEKRSMLEGMAFLYKSSPFQKFDGLNWEVKESVALSVARLVGLSIDMGTLYGQQHLDDLRNMPWD